jgi:hypothetical protein
MEFNEETAKQLLQAVDDFNKAWQKLKDAIDDSLLSAFINLFANSYYASEPSETPHKPVFNCPKYIYIKPNTKPYSAFRRLYRVQGW